MSDLHQSSVIIELRETAENLSSRILVQPWSVSARQIQQVVQQATPVLERAVQQAGESPGTVAHQRAVEASASGLVETLQKLIYAANQGDCGMASDLIANELLSELERLSQL